MATFQAVLFDFDGTLRHNSPTNVDTFCACAQELGLRVTDEDRLRALRFEHYYGAESPEIIADRVQFKDKPYEFWGRYYERKLLTLGATTAQASELGPHINKLMSKAYQPESVLPAGAHDALRQLKSAGYKMSVVSNRTEPFHTSLEQLGLGGYFDRSLSGGEIGTYKPDPAIFEYECRRLGVDPSAAVYVGDNYFSDVIGAQRAGLQPILLDPRGVFKDPGCPVISSFHELVPALNQL